MTTRERPVIEVLFFDFDGVILESVDVKTRAFAKMFEGYGPDVRDRVVEYHLRHGGVSRFEKIRHFHAEFLGKDITEDELQAQCRVFSGLVLEQVKSSEFVPGAKEFLETNASLYRCFVVSGTPEDELRDIVDSRGLTRYFEGVYGAPRKKGEIVEWLIATKALRPESAVFIGDSITDYDASVVGGVGFIGRVPKGVLSPFPAGGIILDDLTPLGRTLLDRF